METVLSVVFAGKGRLKMDPAMPEGLTSVTSMGICESETTITVCVEGDQDEAVRLAGTVAAAMGLATGPIRTRAPREELPAVA